MICTSAVHGLLLASLVLAFVRWLCWKLRATAVGAKGRSRCVVALDGDQGDDNDAKKCYNGDDDSCPKGSMLNDIDLDICE